MDIILGSLLFLFGLGGGYFAAYTKEKGKNLALKEDVAFLENEKHKIQTKYALEIESFKKEISLDFELKKYKYQEKKEQFAKFFTLLDQFHNRSNEITQERMSEITSKFMAGCLSEDAEIQNKAIVTYNKELMDLFSEISREYLKLAAETNSVRLATSQKLDEMIDDLTSNVSEANDVTRSMLQLMATPDFLHDQSILEPYRAMAEKKGNEITALRNNIRAQMKLELDQI